MLLVPSDPDKARARLLRETWTVVIVYLGTLAHAYSYGFSAVAIPDIRNEMRKHDIYLISSFTLNDKSHSIGSKLIEFSKLKLKLKLDK